MMKRLLVYAISLLILSGCNTTTAAWIKPAVPDFPRQPARAAVFQAALNARFDFSEGASIIVHNQTALWGSDVDLETDLAWLSDMQDLSADVLDDFKLQNQQSSPLDQSLLGSNLPYQLADRARFGSLMGAAETGCQANWLAFQQQYPASQGIATLSDAGFSKTGDKALVEVKHEENCSGWHADFLLLEKTESGWTIIDQRGIATLQ